MGLAEDLPYVNARLRARHSRLLGRDRVRELLGLPAVADVLGRLAASGYGADLALAAAGGVGSARSADAALGRSLARDGARVQGFSSGFADSPARFLFAAWDLYNLKVVVRGARAGIASERVLAACVPLGWVRPAVWEELSRSAGLRELVERAMTMELGFRRPLREGWGQFGRSGQVADIERALDRWFYGDALAALARHGFRGGFWRPVRELLHFEVDARNFAVLLEWLGRGQALPGDLLIAGGAVTAGGFFRRLQGAESPSSWLADQLRRWLRGRDGLDVGSELHGGRPWACLAALERAAWRARAGRLRSGPLSPALVAGYLGARAAEAADLRLVLWSIHFGRDPEWTSARLIAA